MLNLNLLKISIVQKDSRNWVEIKLKSMFGGGSDKILFLFLLLEFLIAIIVFYFVIKIPSLPSFFKIGIIIMILISLVIITLSLLLNRQMAVYLSKEGNLLYIRRAMCFHEYEETIQLDKDSKFILVKMLPYQTFGKYQLLLQTQSNLHLIAPKIKRYNLLRDYRIYPLGSAIRRFLYDPEDARKISKLLDIPLEESNKELVKYIEEFKKRNNL